MAKKTEGFSFKDHQRIGKQIHKLRQELRSLENKIFGAYGKPSKAARLCDKILKDLALLQGELNARLCKENPASGNLELLACYYPKQE